jgi:CHAD domain-containing protein
MLTKEWQYKYFNKRWKAMLTHLHSFSGDQKPEEIHQLRVEIKKIYALLTLMENCSDKKKLSEKLKPVKKIFRSAGRIRNIQVSIQLIDKYQPSDKKYSSEQREVLNDKWKKFSSDTNSYIKKIKEPYKMVLKKIEDIKNECIIDLYEKQLKKLGRLLKGSEQEELHKCRKKIKNLRYIYDIVPGSLKKKLKLNRPYLHKLEEVIGKWHDSVISLELLTNTGLADNNKIMTTLENQRNRLNKSIVIMSKNFSEKVMV